MTAYSKFIAKEGSYWADQQGVDCTGATDAASALQTLINTVPNGSAVLFPTGGVIKLGSNISVLNRTNLRFYSLVDGRSLRAPLFLAEGRAGGDMFSVTSSGYCNFSGLRFANDYGTGSAIDKYINFDGNPNFVTPTENSVDYCSFGLEGNSNSNFKCVSISETATDNHENYRISYSVFNGSGGSLAMRSRRASILSTTTTLTAMDGKFTPADIGKKITVTWPADLSSSGMFQSTVVSINSSTSIEMAAPSTASQSNATIHIGQFYGTGLFVGNSQNAKHHIFNNNAFTGCNIGLFMLGGSAQISSIGGGYNWIGISITNTVDPSSITAYNSEGDAIALVLIQPHPMFLNGLRASNSNQVANGFFQLEGRLNVTCAYAPTVYYSNTVLFARAASPGLYFYGNSCDFSTAIANVGWDRFDSAQTTWTNCSFTDAPVNQITANQMPISDPRKSGMHWNSAGMDNISSGKK